MNTELIILALARCKELGGIAFSIHQELEKWREPKFSDIDRTQLSVKLKQAIEEQFKWLRAIEEYMEEKDE